MNDKLEIKELLIRKVLSGDISPDQAEAEARRLGLPPLLRPEEASFDPMGEPSWTLPMVIAWIVWRERRQVLQQWDEYRLQCWNWHTTKGKHILLRMPRAQLSLAGRGLRPEAGHKGLMDSGSAKAELWKVLQEGTLQATAIHTDTGRRVLIPDFEWHELECIRDNWRDILCDRNSIAARSIKRAPPHGIIEKLIAERLRGRNDLNRMRRSPTRGYTDVLVKRTGIISIWPSLDHAQTNPPPAERSHAPDVQPVPTHRVAESRQKQTPLPLKEGLVNSRSEVIEHLVLPQDEPRTRAPLRAYRALRSKFPDGRVPDISMEELAESLTPLLKKMGHRPVGRDAVRRALGLKK